VRGEPVVHRHRIARIGLIVDAEDDGWPGVMPSVFGTGETLFTAPLITARAPGPWTLTQSTSTL
jgi:hypothetical protein